MYGLHIEFAKLNPRGNNHVYSIKWPLRCTTHSSQVLTFKEWHFFNREILNHKARQVIQPHVLSPNVVWMRALYKYMACIFCKHCRDICTYTGNLYCYSTLMSGFAGPKVGRIITCCNYTLAAVDIIQMILQNHLFSWG